MQVQINFQNLSLAQLKEFAAELNAQVEGDRRLRETWIKACELAQATLVAAGKSAKSAAQSVGEAVDELAGAEVIHSLGVTVQAVGEAYTIAHEQFVVPTEKAIVLGWNFATSGQAVRAYLNAAIGVMRFCFAIYKSGMACREWCDEFVAECEESIVFSEDAEPTVERVIVARAYKVGSAIGRRVWALDGIYQVKVVEPIKQEVRAVFSLAEWVGSMMR